MRINKPYLPSLEDKLKKELNNFIGKSINEQSKKEINFRLLEFNNFIIRERMRNNCETYTRNVQRLENR